MHGARLTMSVVAPANSALILDRLSLRGGDGGARAMEAMTCWRINLLHKRRDSVCGSSSCLSFDLLRGKSRSDGLEYACDRSVACDCDAEVRCGTSFVGMR